VTIKLIKYVKGRSVKKLLSGLLTTHTRTPVKLLYLDIKLVSNKTEYKPDSTFFSNLLKFNAICFIKETLTAKYVIKKNDIQLAHTFLAYFNTDMSALKHNKFILSPLQVLYQPTNCYCAKFYPSHFRDITFIE